MENNKENKILEFFSSLPSIWFDAFKNVFIFVMFLEMGLISYKLFDNPNIVTIHMKFMGLFIVGGLYLLFLYGVVFIFIKKFLPTIQKERGEKKKEFFNELSKELKKGMKSKK